MNGDFKFIAIHEVFVFVSLFILIKKTHTYIKEKSVISDAPCSYLCYQTSPSQEPVPPHFHSQPHHYEYYSNINFNINSSNHVLKRPLLEISFN